MATKRMFSHSDSEATEEVYLEELEEIKAIPHHPPMQKCAPYTHWLRTYGSSYTYAPSLLLPAVVMEDTPKSGDVTNIVWNVVDNSLSTTF